MSQGNTSNLYQEEDWNDVSIRYPDGSVKVFKMKRVKDTAGNEFYTLSDDTQISST